MDTWIRSTFSGNSGVNAGGFFGQQATIAPYVSVKPNSLYNISVYVNAGTSFSKLMDLRTQVFGSDGALLSGGTTIASMTVTTAGINVQRLSGVFKTPANAARLGLFMYAGGGSQFTSGQIIDSMGWQVTEGPELLPYIDGSAPTTANYSYAWSGDAHASASTRTPITPSPSRDALIWKTGQSALEFIVPLAQAVGLRPVCDESRQWTLRNENYVAPGALSIRHGINLIDANETISRDSGLWFDAQVTRYTSTDADGIQQVTTDAYALNTPYTRLNLVEVNAPYPGPGRSQYAVRRAQGRGREVTATAVADWNTRAEQPITVVLENAPTQIGTTTSVNFNLDNDEMTVTTRTTDTPAGAIDLLPGIIDALVGTIDSLS